MLKMKIYSSMRIDINESIYIHIHQQSMKVTESMQKFNILWLYIKFDEYNYKIALSNIEDSSFCENGYQATL